MLSARALDARQAMARPLIFGPSKEIIQTPTDAGLAFRDLWFEAGDGPSLHGWWIPTPHHRRGQVLLCHGNGGNIGDRMLEARALTTAGFDTLLFDYRGYGRSNGRPDEQGTYRDARAARAALLAQPEADPERVIYLGESLGGAVALRLAVELPPAGLILSSTFTSIRDIARHHYPFIPPVLVPDWYPSLKLVARLRAPLLVLHGDRDDIVPLAHGEALYEAAPEPKQIHVFAGCGHNDVVALAGAEYGSVIADWATDIA